MTTSTTTVKVKRTSDHRLPLPEFKSAGAAGADLRALGDYVLEPGARLVIKTGFAMAIPEGFYGRVAPRSGLAVRHGIDTLAGVVDADYRGEIGVVLINHGGHDFVICEGDRIAQLVLEVCAQAAFEETDDLASTTRGAGGFGSSGTR